MRNFAWGLASAVAFAAAPLAVGAITMPAVASAEPLACPGGQYWEPSTNTCMPLGQGPKPLDCPPGEYWQPFGNACRPLGQI
ncbi:hypothetical protein [Mycolicibacter arupensis]|uniref:Chitin-binding type-2 domain-containing protein n=1 Tax=Mycolicibacter arupensis TaxID=342002 RepID=A0A5C7XNF6_9MYCO|nr:hypothetical protein [Mycolicibacter arupensis]TXI50999.1 MAG: hypothetical protein E6Q54_20930 [Mycolicibacter arupensis]